MTETEEKALVEVLTAARTVQDFLWKRINEKVGAEEFRRMLRKRVAKLDAIDFGNPYWRIEFRKRLLQMAAIAVNAIGKLDDGYDFFDRGVPSNLPQYSEPITENCEPQKDGDSLAESGMEKMQGWEIWSEGYAITGNSATASLLGTVLAPTFREACIAHFELHDNRHLFNEESLTFWGCQLFPDEASAKKSFG